MLKKNRRNMIIFSIVIVMCFFTNYALNKWASLETSSEFEKYEEEKLSEENKENASDLTYVEKENGQNNIALIDSSNRDDTEVGDVVVEASKNIKSSISKKAKRANYFIESRLNTDIEREKMVGLLNEIINNEKTDEPNRKAANDEKMKLVEIMGKEKIIENLIKSKGFEEALVFITDNSANIIVETEKLTDSDVAKILDIVMREIKVPTENIKISNIF